MSTSKAVKCKICGKKYVSKQALIDHIDRSHAANIPEGWNAARYENFLRTGKTEGRCVYCHKPTGWNDATGKYNRMCGSEKCKKIARDRANKNYIGLHGKPYSINDPEQQKKMVYGRKNSGKYVFEGEDGKKYVAMYDSSYGKDFFEMIDTFLNWDGSDIIAPSPHTYWYEYEGKKHFYIPDAYSTSLNLEIEFKDGGDNPNKHPKIQAVDKVKEQKKDEVMNSLKDQVNYIKICNKDYTGFFAMLSKLKQKDVCPLPIWDSKLESITESFNLTGEEYVGESYAPKSIKMYHASPIQGLKEISPRQETFNVNVGNVDMVYASPDKRFSACFGSKWNDDIGAQGSWDNWNTIIFGVSDKIDMNSPCSMYELENNGTFERLNNREYVSTKPVRVKKETRYNTFKEMLLKNGVKIVSYDDYKSNVGSSNPRFTLLESDIDSEFSYYHLEKEKKKNPGGWDEEQYFKTLDFAIRQELSEISLNEQKGCVTRYVYTLGKEYSAILLGTIAIKWYDYWDHADPQYEYYWDSKEDVDKDEIVSEREATMESSTKKNSSIPLSKSFLKRHAKLKHPMLNYDDLMESYRQKLFHSNLKPYEWQSLYNELINVREYLTKVVNGQSDEDKRMNYEASKALKEVEGFIQYMEEKNSTMESTDIFTEGDFSEYGKFADLDSVKGPIEEELVTESSDYNEYMINGNYDYINQVLKRMVSPIKHTNMYDIFNINFGIPNNMDRTNVEKQVELVGEKIYKTYWAKNKGTKANMYAPFKFYSECNNPDEYNIIYSKYAAPFKKPCLYFYNFENNGRRYSTVIVTGNNNEPDIYLIYKNRLINVDKYKSTTLIESIVTESSNSGKVPIYIIAYRYRSPFGAMVRLKTHSEFNHVAIALSDDFEHAYTFSRRTDIDNGKMGFTEEPLSYMVKTDNTTRIKILKVYISKRNYSKLEGIISEYNAHKNETKFNWGGMIDIVHKNGIDNDELDDMTMVCSSFVDYVLKESGVDLTKKPNSNLVTPEDLASSEKSNNNVSVIYQGLGRDYDPKIIQESLDSYINSPNMEDNIMETKNLKFKELLHSINTPKELSDWMKSNIHYKEYDRLMTANEVFDKKRGSCHDQVNFETVFFKKFNIKYGKVFLIEYNEGEPTGGRTHSFIWFNIKDKYYWFENAWSGEQGIHGPYDSIIDIKKEVKEKMLKGSRFNNVEFSSVKNVKPGMRLDEFVTSCLESTQKTSLPVTESSLKTPETVSDYLKIAKLINAKTVRDKKEPVGNQNCQLCTWCFEARIRGIDVLPRPVYSPRDIIFSHNGYDIVKLPIKIKIKSKNDIVNNLRNSGDGSRYYVHVNWKGSSGGHEFLLANIGGKIYVLDGQAGLVSDINSTKGSAYFKNANLSNSFIVRMDDKDFNNELLLLNNDSYIIDWSDDDEKLLSIDEATHIEAMKDDTKYYPVFIFLSYTGTNMAKIIKAFTHDPYAHSSLSFDTELNHMISFNKDGMVDENIFESVYKKKAANIRYSLYVYMATADEYEAMKDFVNTLLGRRSKLRYNLLGLTNFIFGRGSEREDRFFCSEFVASVISAGNNKIFKTRPYMTSPYMLAKNKNFVFIKTGILKNYDSKVVDKIVAEKLEEGGFTNVSFE